MFNVNSFHRTEVLKLHYLCFFLRKQLQKSSKAYFESQGLNEIKCKITSKLQENLK